LLVRSLLVEADPDARWLLPLISGRPEEIAHPDISADDDEASDDSDQSEDADAGEAATGAPTSDA
jgi:hypothetical protein